MSRAQLNRIASDLGQFQAVARVEPQPVEHTPHGAGVATAPGPGSSPAASKRRAKMP